VLLVVPPDHEAKEAWSGHRHRRRSIGIEQSHGFVRRGWMIRQRDIKLCETGNDGGIRGNTSPVQALQIPNRPLRSGDEQLTHGNHQS